MNEKLLIVISGPSGVGKRCLMESIELHCKLGILKTNFRKIVLYNTREIRKGERDEKDYYYCYGRFLPLGTTKTIQDNKKEVSKKNTKKYLEQEKLIHVEKHKNLFMFSVRGEDLQAIDLNEIQSGVNFLEIFDPFCEALKPEIEKRSIKLIRLFVSPLTRNEIRQRSLDEDVSEGQVIKNEMSARISDRRKLGLSNEKIQNFEKRINNAIAEIDEAFTDEKKYDAILINPCSEADLSWGTKNTMPTGKAREVVNTACQIISANI